MSRERRTLRRATIAAALTAGLAAAAPRTADAFCGFYVSGADAPLFNNATMVVLMRDGIRTVLSMQNNYQGPPQDFAMVIPVPVILEEENVKTLSNEVFRHVDQLAAPRLVEYWEQDPCMVERPGRVRRKLESTGALPVPSPSFAEEEDLGVTVEAEFEVGEYQIVILSAKDSGGLDTWLRRERYNIPSGAEPLLRPYVEEGMKFFVAKVDVKKVQFDAKNQAQLSPLRFHYDSPEFRLPVRLGLINSGGTQDLMVHILSERQRYELANMPNVTIPTNLDVDDAARSRFGELYAALFDATLERNPGAAITEYAWDAATCDPCPTPPLSPSDLTTLGSDVLANSSPYRSFVLTRLHLRYDKDSLGEDLIFREAGPLVGGREFMMGDKLEKGAREGSVNNFQARYAIRHRWTGPVTCDNPRWGRWGGPPSNPAQKPQPKAAEDLAFAPRGALQLARMIKEPVPELALMAADLQPPEGKTVAADRPPTETPAPGQGDPASKDAKAAAAPKDPAAGKGSASAIARDAGCTCHAGEPADGAPAGLLFGALLLWRRRRG